MIPRLIRFGVLMMCVYRVPVGSADAPRSPIDVVRSLTVGNGTGGGDECFESQDDMPQVYWHRASLEPKLALIRSLSAQNATFRGGEYPRGGGEAETKVNEGGAVEPVPEIIGKTVVFKFLIDTFLLTK